MNALYKIGNALVGTIFAATMGWAVYTHAPEFWNQMDATFAGAGAVVALVGVLVVGFVTLETRKA